MKFASKTWYRDNGLIDMTLNLPCNLSEIHLRNQKYPCIWKFIEKAFGEWPDNPEIQMTIGLPGCIQKRLSDSACWSTIRDENNFRIWIEDIIIRNLMTCSFDLFYQPHYKLLMQIWIG